ncbi:hypothetical protein JCM11251_000918 [Rhodosporidiobolus azoricus]
MSPHRSFPLPLAFALSTLLLILLLPLTANAQYNSASPACARSCYTKALERVTNGDWARLSVGDTTGRCAHKGFNAALSKCWETTCDSDADVATGQSLWNAACTFASSTKALQAGVMTSLMDKIEAEPTFAKISAHAIATPLPILEKRSTSSAPSSTKSASRTASHLLLAVSLVLGLIQIVA